MQVVQTSRVGVIVPTRNRVESLRRLLASLESLDQPGFCRVELFVVNNGSSDGTTSFLAGEQTKPKKLPLRVLEEKRPGKAHALNVGLACAQADYILVVDDDVVVHPGWLAMHLECYRTTLFDAIQGRVLPGVDPEGRPADPRRLREYNIPIIDYGEEVCEIRGMTGTNMSFKREVFEKVGFFDPRLGPGAAGFSEDTEYSMRIRQAGFKIGYAPRAVVYHELDPRRYGKTYNRTVQYRKGLSRSLYRRQSIPFNVLPNMIASCVRYLIYRAMGKRQKAYKTEGRIMKYWGYLVGRFRRRTETAP